MAGKFDKQLKKETIELRLWQWKRAVLLDWVLRRQSKEWEFQLVRFPRDGN